MEAIYFGNTCAPFLTCLLPRCPAASLAWPQICRQRNMQRGAMLRACRHWMQNAGDNTTVGPDGKLLDGPWVGADLEAGMYYGGGKVTNSSPPSVFCLCCCRCLTLLTLLTLLTRWLAGWLGS